MKVLVLTDIHSDYQAARSAFMQERPDLVLDCGDHEEMHNIAELTPHYFVPGNHEPAEVIIDAEGYPMPHAMGSGVVYFASDINDTFTFAGFGGNYSQKPHEKHVGLSDLEKLSGLKRDSIDVLMFHESPVNSMKENDLAKGVYNEIRQIAPRIVFSGHTGVYSDQKVEVKGRKGEFIRMVNLDDMARGYGILDTRTGNFIRKISRWR